MRRLIVFVLIFALLSLIFFSLNRAFPYVSSGPQLITEAKLQAPNNHLFFESWNANPGKPRVVVFGNSLALSGFSPELFDKLSASRVASVNMAIPENADFIPLLESMIEAGKIPTHVLLTVDWTENPLSGKYSWLLKDSAVREKVFPFHAMPRDLVLFAILSRKHGGIVEYYKYTKHEVDQMVIDKGYYFISGQSHFPNDQLPADFSLPNDHPLSSEPTEPLCVECPAFNRIKSLAAMHNFKVYRVPCFLRESYSAPPDGPNQSAINALRAHPEFRILGTDYVTFPNNRFSDQKHLNRTGAAEYTELLWRLLEKEIVRGSK